MQRLAVKSYQAHAACNPAMVYGLGHPRLAQPSQPQPEPTRMPWQIGPDVPRAPVACLRRRP
eukprot:1735509-Pyramimonas_sp.AAC.1